MSKKTVFIIVAVLVATVGVFAYLNGNYVKDKKEIHINAELIVKADGNETLFTLDEIKKLGEKEFKANLKSSGNPPVEHTYTGVALKNVIEKANINIADKSQVTIRSVDGYTVAMNMDEVLEDDNVYLTYMVDGQPLGNREDGGSGPYQIVISKDQFSQRWAKYVVEIELQ